MKLISILFVITLLPLVAQAQQTKPLRISSDQAVTNDDLGKAFILERNLQPLSSLGRAGKGTTSEPHQCSIFFGSGWAGGTLHQRKTKLGSLLANVTNEDELAALQEVGIKNRFGPTASIDWPDVASGGFADLDVQRTLATMVTDRLLPRPTAKTIFVIFLDSSLQSTLGSLMAGKHYAAYHSAFTVAGARVRYVVMPFESDERAAYQIALRAFVAAAVKPGQPGTK